MDRSTPIADLDLPAFARDLLRQWCPEVVTVGDLDARQVRRRFATGVGLYGALGLRPIGPDDAEGEAPAAGGADAGCLYVRGGLDAVRAELVAIYARMGCARRPEAPAQRAAASPHDGPRAAWTADVVGAAPAADGLVAVSSLAWGLAWPGANQLAVELSRAFPVLAVTRCAAFTELSMYRGGSAYTAVTRSADPALRASFRPSVPKALLVAAFGARPQWDAADALAPDALGYDGQAPTDGWLAFDAAPAPAPAVAPAARPAAKPSKPSKPLKPAKPAKRRPADEDADEDEDEDADEAAPKSAAKAAKAAPKAAAKKGGATSGAAVMAIVSKAVFDKDCPGAGIGDVLGLDRYTSSNPGLAKAAGGSLFLVTVRPGDKLWLVGILDGPSHGGGAWTAAASDVAVTDISAVSITFDSGVTLAAAPGKLGMSLQTPRALSAATADALRAAAARR